MTYEEAVKVLDPFGNDDPEESLFISAGAWPKILEALNLDASAGEIGQVLIDLEIGSFAKVTAFTDASELRAQEVLLGALSDRPAQQRYFAPFDDQKTLQGDRMWELLRDTAAIPGDTASVSFANQRYVIDLRPGWFATMYFQTGVRVEALAGLLGKIEMKPA